MNDKQTTMAGTEPSGEGQFNDVSLDVLGLDNGQSLRDEVQGYLKRAASQTSDPARGNTATITMTIKVIGDEDGTTKRIQHSVSYSEPQLKRRGTVAFLGKSGFKTQEGKQERLPLPIDINRKPPEQE